ncbi:hypothetical protein DTL42_19555 [Bremerella cremea]|uniref:Uncharacterized protein n=1 Tax=Bremerella cremea TaxID=1031537 RepID=A0A368KM15_9BACT|nr:hypothetical protein DTL42_19555 [Bremerella cremea]
MSGKREHAQLGIQSQTGFAALESEPKYLLATVDFREAKRHPNPGKMPGAHREDSMTSATRRKLLGIETVARPGREARFQQV